MKISIILLFTVAMSVAISMLTACNKEKDDKSTSEISTDMAELSEMINLPYQPKAVWWQVTRLGTPDTPRAPGPSDWKLEAVMLFDKKDVEAILKKSKPVTTPVYSPEQEEIVKKYKKYHESNMIDRPSDSSDEALHNLLKEHGELEEKIYEPKLFTYRDGRLVRLKGTDKLFLSYQTR